MTPAERMRKHRARKHLRAAWERAIMAGLDPYEVMGVTPIGVTGSPDRATYREAERRAA